MLKDFPGTEPKKPAWGQEKVNTSPFLADRLKNVEFDKNQVNLVLGAGGSLAPDLINGLRLKHGLVMGIDKELSYRCAGTVYRWLDLTDKTAVADFVRDLKIFLKERHLKLGIIFDLATIQVNPRKKRINRRKLINGKIFMIKEMLNQLRGLKIRYVYMSTAEVYGRSKQLPFLEEAIKKPFNRYGKAKLREEKKLLAIKNNHFWLTGLRSYLIAMPSFDQKGRIMNIRNYGGAKIILAARIASLGIKPPIINSHFIGQLHLAEEVVEMLIKLGLEPKGSKVWREMFNCPGRPAEFGKLIEAAYKQYMENYSVPNTFRTKFYQFFLPTGVLPKAAYRLMLLVLRPLIKSLGGRDLKERVPYLFQSYYLDNSKIKKALRGKLSYPKGGSSIEAAKRLSMGVRNGGLNQMIFERYKMY